jgi:rifampicin phosphotransferase
VDSQAQIENDPTIVSDLIKSSQTSIEELKQNIRTKSGVATRPLWPLTA